MSLMDAPAYDAQGDVRKRNIMVAVAAALVLIVAVAFAGFFTGHGWLFLNVPAEHRVDRFMTAVESKDLPRAFGIWNNDDAWQQHPEKFKDYNYGHFQVDWGNTSDFGIITSHKVVCSLSSGSGVTVGVDINGRKQPTFLWVQNRTHTLGFSPVEIEC